MRKFLLCCVVAFFWGGCSDGEPSVDNPVRPSDYSAEKELTKSSSSDRGGLLLQMNFPLVRKDRPRVWKNSHQVLLTHRPRVSTLNPIGLI